jgi:hypothetical protein
MLLVRVTDCTLFLEHNKTKSLIVTDREKAALSKAVGVHTIAQVTQIWAHRLHLTSIYVSQNYAVERCLTWNAHTG